MKECKHDSYEKYKLLIGPLREEAKRLGYALGVHGTLKRDIDLIACPWSDEAVSAVELAEALRLVAEKVNGMAVERDKQNCGTPEYFERGCPGYKAHGRRCWTFHLGEGVGPYIDLSVMPKALEFECKITQIQEDFKINQIHDLDDFVGGWFVGNFEPSIWKLEHAEVAVKRYKAGDKEPIHVHKIADELTVVVSGTIKMNGKLYEPFKIIPIWKSQKAEFEAVTDAITVVVKSPSVKGDKHEVDSTSG